jgi:hypothetical protein
MLEPRAPFGGAPSFRELPSGPRPLGLDPSASSSREMFSSDPALVGSSFSFFDFVLRGTSPLTYRDRGRMGGMVLGIGWPPPPRDGPTPLSIGS